MQQHTDTHLPYIITALLVSVLPHLGRLPAWITAWCLLMWACALLLPRLQWPGPGRKVRVLLAILGLTGLLATYATRLGPNAYLGLLVLMAGLKPFEISTHRDRMLTLFLAYFIVITSLFQSESLGVTIYLFVSVFVTTGVLIRINDPGGSFKADIRLSGVIMAQAIPLMVVLFLLFPRLEGSLFGLSRAPEAQTGFSDRLSPGSISRLVENNEVAFRAEFDGRVPEADRLYWRGIVFHAFDGREWRRSRKVPEIKDPPEGEGLVAYRIALEPHGQQWLFALERPATKPDRSRMLADFTIKQRRRVKRTKYYEMRSYAEPLKGSGWGVEQAGRLPERGNPRARQLAAGFSRGADSVDAIVDKAGSYLQSRGFVYTLQPPALGEHPIDDFLFESRKGYCEHYASAFAFLMRAAGVPARVVGGYLGGERNPFGDYLIVRQSDAHAWVEVWAEDRGWMRVDPTALVAPGRITQGLSGALPEGEWSSGGLALFNKLRLGWDAVSLGWEAWFTGYSHMEQRALLERLGIQMESRKGWLIVFLLIFASVFLLVGGYVWFQLRSPPAARKDRVKLCYERFCRRLAQAGIYRSPEMGPRDFAAHAASERPDLKPAIDEIVSLYIRLRYHPGAGGPNKEPDKEADKEPNKELEKRFCEKVKRFRPAGRRRPR